MTTLVALDAGTTGVRALAVDEEGAVSDVASRTLPQHFPRPGWVEHDPDDIWRGALEVLAEVAARVGARNERVAAVGVTNQRETAVAWDRDTGRPLHRAVVWQDRRTTARCRQLAEDGRLGVIRERTGLVLDPYFSATKFEWLLTEGGVPVSDRLALGTVDAWLLWRLTGGARFVTDVTNASRTMLFDIGTLRWTPDLCGLFGVPSHTLAEVVPSCGRIGTIDGELAAAVPGLRGVAVSGVAGDQQAALFGQACFSPGLAKATYGTGTFVLVNAGAVRPEAPDGLLTTVAWDLGPRAGRDERVTYALEGSDLASGAAVEWLRDGLGVLDAPDRLEELATSADDSGGLVAVPAFAGLGSPWWDPGARGTIVGITRGSGRAQLARAVVEAVAFSVRDILDAMSRASGRPCTELRVDGGMTAMDLLLQTQADQLGIPVVRPRSPESTALGAAMLAGLAEGVWSGLDDLAGVWHEDARKERDLDPAWADLAHEAWSRALDRARDWEHD